jgi:hypothetical protein
MDPFSRYEQDLISMIKAAKTKLADQIPLSEKGPLTQLIFSNPFSSIESIFAEERKILIRDVSKQVEDINLIVS